MQLVTQIIYGFATNNLSIPFVGFLRMQPVLHAVPLGGVSIAVLSIPFVGFLRMQLEVKGDSGPD